MMRGYAPSWSRNNQSARPRRRERSSLENSRKAPRPYKTTVIPNSPRIGARTAARAKLARLGQRRSQSSVTLAPDPSPMLGIYLPCSGLTSQTARLRVRSKLSRPGGVGCFFPKGANYGLNNFEKDSSPSQAALGGVNLCIWVFPQISSRAMR